MLHSIRTSHTPPFTSQQPTDLLLACHARIRHFSDMAIVLANRLDAPPEQVRETATALQRYFTIALPLHEADEEESLAPRLRATALADALDQMREQHRLLHEILEELLPCWSVLSTEPELLPELAPTLGSEARRLGAVFDVHLELEESSIFPHVEGLDPSVRAAILAEIKDRRAP